MTTLWVLPNDRSHSFRKSIKSAAHVRRFASHPDPRSLCAIHRLQARQSDHSAASTTASNARTCLASNPGLTIRLRPFLNRISMLESAGALGPCSATCTSRNFAGVSSSSRFFHTKKYGRHKPRSPQNAFTVCPLRACSETSLRHFVHAFFECLVMLQHCNGAQLFYKMGFAYRSLSIFRDFYFFGYALGITVRASGCLGDQSSGGNVTRQNVGRASENSRPISPCPARTGPRNTTRHSCSSCVCLCCISTLLPFVSRACSSTSAPCALIASVDASSSNFLPCASVPRMRTATCINTR